jgi:hypothetical protein
MKLELIEDDAASEEDSLLDDAIPLEGGAELESTEEGCKVEDAGIEDNILGETFTLDDMDGELE